MKNSPLLQKAKATIQKEGFGPFFRRSWVYLKKNKHLILVSLTGNEYERWLKKNALTEETITMITNEIAGFQYKPMITIIMPVYNIEPAWLEKAIESVIAQLYPRWELCITDDGSRREGLKEMLDHYAENYEQIRIEYLEENHGISAASNEGLPRASGEFVAFLDHDDELAAEALYEYVKLLNKHPEADLIYSDEDKIDVNGRMTEPFFKPDYSPELLLSMNYICHFSMFRKSLIDDIGGFRPEYDGSQDYDLLLRFMERTEPGKIFHVPKILYHWRKVPGSAAGAIEAKGYAFDSAKKALADYLTRNSIAGEVVDGKFRGAYRIKRRIEDRPVVSVIIPFKDNPKALEICLSSIVKKSSYENYRIFLVDNQSEQDETFSYLETIVSDPLIKILNYDQPFNYSALCNHAISRIDSDYFILLNNDTEIISPHWIEAMLEFVQREEIGAAGALLYYPNNTIQHCGVVVGIGGGAAHVYQHFAKDCLGYFGRIKLIQNLSAVTGACLMGDKVVFNEVSGFDENLSYSFNDVDFCLRIQEKGYRVVYTPYAEVYHHESLTRGRESSSGKKQRLQKELQYFREKWKWFLEKGDPYYNPNLTLDKLDFSIGI